MRLKEKKIIFLSHFLYKYFYLNLNEESGKYVVLGGAWVPGGRYLTSTYSILDLREPM